MSIFETGKKGISPLEISAKQFAERRDGHLLVAEQKIRADFQALFPDIWTDAKRFTENGDAIQQQSILHRYTPENESPNNELQTRIDLFQYACGLLKPKPKTPHA